MERGYEIVSSIALLVTAIAVAAQSDVRQIEQSFQTAIARAEPAIACLLVSKSEAHPTPNSTRKSFDPDNRDTPPDYYGSGVVIDPQGHILTNFHVVRDAINDRVYVRLPGRVQPNGVETPPREGWATIYAADNRSDLAVLRFRASRGPTGPLPAVTIGRGETLSKGSFVLALGHPYAAGFSDGSPSASWGIVSNLRRRQPGSPIEVERGKMLHFLGTLLQTDAKMQLGSSGGALLDLDGKLVGLTTSQAALTGVDMPGGFAIPLDANVRRIIEVLQRGEEVEYGFLGVTASADMSRDRPRPGGGVVLQDVMPNSPAMRAGLRRGDIVLQVNGQPIRESDDLFLHLGASLAGRRAEVLVQRPGERMPRTMDVVLAKSRVTDVGNRVDISGGVGLEKLNSQDFGKATNRAAPFFGLRVDYTSVIVRAEETVPDGVVVREALDNSPAKEKGLTPYVDIITEVNDQRVNTPAEFTREVTKASKNGDKVRLTLKSPPRTITLP